MDYPIVAMIGSSRFKQEYHDEGKRLTLEGKSCYSIMSL